MFEIDTERTSLPLPPDRVLALISSLNAPMVVAADMPVEPTRAYICAYQEGSDRVAFSIYLHRVESNQGAFYRYDGGLVPRMRFDDVMGEAMAFAESLGFMLDDLGWKALSRARQDELMRETPIFLDPSARAQVNASTGAPAPSAAALLVDEVDAGLVGATPISPVPDPPVVPAGSAVATPPPPEAAPPGPPLATTFVPPPGAATPPSPLPAASSPSPARPEAGAPPGSSPGRELPSAPLSSGTREIELTLDVELPEVASPAPAAATPPASARASALPGAPSPSPGRELPGAPPSSSPARESPGAPHSSIPGGAAAAQALVRLLASL